MDKSAIKNFAVNARKKLKEQIEQNAYALGITKNEIKKPNVHEDLFEINGNMYEKRTLKHRDSLVSKINEKGYDQLIEEVAYTWFNRLIAIRFMEVNEYLPTGVRVLSSTDPNKSEPDVIREVLHIDLGLNQDLVYKLQDENKTEELFKYILIKQCNELGKIMPVVFEKIEDYTELLLPDNLLQEGSIIRDLATSIQEDDWKEQVEIIGWLYQYYISEQKDKVFADIKNNKKVPKEGIPAATQLFTPKWIAKYMVENSIGRLWMENHDDTELKLSLKYFVEDAEQGKGIDEKIKNIRQGVGNPEEIKILDCCVGSGQILVDSFDLMYNIYKSAGYSEREIPRLILEKNLYGLDIDERAVQLAYFSVLMKARSYNRRILREHIDLNICAIHESNNFPKQAIDYLVNRKDLEIVKAIKKDEIEYIVNTFNDAKEYGSLLEVKKINFDAIEQRLEEIRNNEVTDIFELQYKNIILDTIPYLLKQARILSDVYDIVITNPPYMGSRKGMNNNVKKFTEKNYSDSKADLYACFIERCIKFSKRNRYVAMITQHSFMFTDDYKKLRDKLLDNINIVNMAHLGADAFPEISGEVVQTTSFILFNNYIEDYKGKFVRLVDFSCEVKPEKLHSEELHFSNYKNYQFKEIKGCPISYWVSRQMKQTFLDGIEFDEVGRPRQGLATGENEVFVRLWYEVNYKNIGFEYQSIDDFHKSSLLYVPYNKGGKQRKWYGNNDFLLKFDKYYFSILEKQGNHLPSRKFYFKKCITWSDISGRNFAGRYCDYGFVFDVKGSSGFPEEKDIYYVLAFLNSKLVPKYIDTLNPTLTTQVGDLKRLPILEVDESKKEKINILSEENVSISRNEWDSFETSWGFTKHPLLYFKSKLIKNSYNEFLSFTKQKFHKLKKNEEEINKIFIDIYGLSNELDFIVDNRDITITISDDKREIKSFMSYAVGCIFGRYSLDYTGLVYAGGEFNQEQYKSFKVDLDNVIPITDDEYFEDDIVSRFVDFVKVTYSEETLEENLDFIADTLGKKGNETSRQTIRRYFLKDFYKDHVQIYQKKPIYWLFDSGKNDGFKALIYMHRYDIGNVARVRTDYLHLLQRKYEAEINRLDMVIESNTSTREKNEARKKKEKIQKQIEECKQYDQIIAHVANQKISIDLDDGVTVNYAKFQGVEVPQGEGRKPLKADLLAKI